jgi:hypothetical protein
LRKLSDKKNENDFRTETSWKKRIKKPAEEEQESELHETEPFVDVKFNDLDMQPHEELHIGDSETRPFVDIQMNNTQLSGRICRKCRYQIKEENTYFCPKCGSRIKNTIFTSRR